VGSNLKGHTERAPSRKDGCLAQFYCVWIIYINYFIVRIISKQCTLPELVWVRFGRCLRLPVRRRKLIHAAPPLENQ